MSDEVQRDLGNLEDRFDALEKKVDDLAADMKEVLARTNIAAGGIRVLIGIGAAGAGIGAAVGEFLHWFHGSH